MNYLNERQHQYIFSVILSYLNENDGTCFLITNKKWARCILPMFQLPQHLIVRSRNCGGESGTGKGTGTDIGSKRIKQQRHRFMTMPIVDSNVLLARLNTRRLSMRIKERKREKIKIDKKQTGKKGQSSNGDALGSDTGSLESNCGSHYPLNMTTDEIAWEEWKQARLKFMQFHDGGTPVHVNGVASDTCTTNTATDFQCEEAKLELLRYRLPPPTYKIPKQIPQSSCSVPPPPKILPHTTLLTSYPRSGNTLLRNLLERITNIVTGSDTRPDRTLSKSLALEHNLVGEGITTPSLSPIIKTHFPERRGYKMYNTTKRIILLVRNPYDAIDSYWNMCCTNTHTESVVEDIYCLYREKFESLAKSEICTWFQFVKYWLVKGGTTFIDGGDGGGSVNINKNDDCGNDNGGDEIDREFEKRPPILIIRFEDLILRTEYVMEEVISFMTHEKGGGSDDYSKTELHPFWKWRIRHGLDLTASVSTTDACASDGTDTSSNKINVSDSPPSQNDIEKRVKTLQLGSYKPRSEKQSSINSVGKSIRKERYTKEMLSYFQQMAQKEEFQLSARNRNQKVNILELFGYDIANQNFPNNFEDNINRSSADADDFNSNLNKDFGQFIFRGSKGGQNEDKNILHLNLGPELRSASNPFGRVMTNWRRSQTLNDTIPFPTVRK